VSFGAKKNKREEKRKEKRKSVVNKNEHFDRRQVKLKVGAVFRKQFSLSSTCNYRSLVEAKSKFKKCLFILIL